MTDTFHYLVVPGEDGGVERASGQAIGVGLDAVLAQGLPPLSVALALITAVAEVVAILEDDGRPHGHLDAACIFVDDTGTVSIEGFGTEGASRAADRFALGRLALELLGGGRFEPPSGPRDHEEALLDQLLMTDLSELDGAIVGDVQWFLARLLDYHASRRPDPVQVWRSFVAFSNATPGPRLAAWSASVVEGSPILRAVDPGQPAGSGPRTVHGTAFRSKDALKTAEREPPPGGGDKTGYWTADQLQAMEEEHASAPRPRRCSGVALKRQETQIRAPSSALLRSSGPLPEEVSIRRRAAHRPAAPTVLEVGNEAVIDDDRRQFIVEQCLGRGGFGEVYLCTMASTGGMRSKVAVKVLREGIDPRAQAVRRLRDEARVLGSLQHPAILNALDLVVLAERVAMVTEYVPGADLDVCMDDPDPPSLRALLEILAVTSEALDACWRSTDTHGNPLHLVHRDIKPSNIRIGTHGQVKVLDFGIAKFASSREAKTQVNQMIGTMSYMAPERLSAATDHPAGDVYAIGAILYEALAGKALWSECTQRQQYMWSMVESEYDAYVMPRIDALTTHDALREVVRSTVLYGPDDRPTAGELARVIEDISDEVPGRNLRRWARDHQWPAPEALDAELVGRTITEGRASTNVSRMNTERPVSPRPPAAPETPRAVDVPSTFSEEEEAALPPGFHDEPTARALPTLSEPPGAEPSAVRPLDQTEFGEWFTDDSHVSNRPEAAASIPPPPPPNLKTTTTLSTNPGSPERVAAPSQVPAMMPPPPEPEPPAAPAPVAPAAPTPAPAPVHPPPAASTPAAASPAAARSEPEVAFGALDPNAFDAFTDPDAGGGGGLGKFLVAGVLGLMLFAGAMAVAAGVGLFFFAGPTGGGDPVPDPTPVAADPVPTPRPPVPDGPDPTRTQQPTPAHPTPAQPMPGQQEPPNPPSPVTPAPGVVAPAPGPVGGDPTAPDPQQPEPDDGVAVVDQAATANDVNACGEPATLEPRATTGKLTPAERTCLEARMSDRSMKQTDRQKLGRILLVDAQTGCNAGQPCSTFETLQERFFEDVDRSDPDMMLNYAKHQHDSAGTSTARHQKAIRWATLALGRQGQWSGRSRSSKLLAAHKVRALSSHEIYKADPSDANRQLARDYVVEWAEQRRSYNVPATAAFELCASITGSMEVCDKRITTDAVKEEVLFISLPMGARLTVDGKAVGATPQRVQLTHGDHQVEMTLGETTSARSIKVGAGQASRWQWVKAEDAWNPTL